MAFNKEGSGSGFGIDSTRLDTVVPKQMANIMLTIASDLGTSFGMILFTFMSAVLSGDITIARSFRNRAHFTLDISDSASDLLLTFKDRDGKVINPSRLTDDLVDMFYGIYDLGEETYE